MAYTTDTRSSAPGLRTRIADLFATLADRRARAQVYRTTLAELQGLTDRDLADLGISRSMVRSIAHEAAYGK